MKRFALPLVIVGSLAVLVALFALLRAITEDAPAAPPPAARPETPPSQAPAVTPAPTPSVTTPLSSVSGPRPRVAEPAPGPAPSSPTPNLGASSDDAPPGTRQNTKNLQFGLVQLREKISGNAPQVAACIGDSKPTGSATLTFIVAQRAGKIVVEQTDVDHDATTIKDETLVDCLAKTALAMKFDGLPREAEAIVVTRVMSLADGAVAEDKPLKFSYLR